MWKDFFSFTKRERITIVALILFILVVQILLWTSDRWMKLLPLNVQEKYRQEKELEAFSDSISAERKKGRAGNTYYQSNGGDFSRKEVKLVPFNPNTADSLTLLRLGLRSYVVRNILKYRSKGGAFRKASDFGRIYGMDSIQFKLLEPYIRLAGDPSRMDGASGRMDGTSDPMGDSKDRMENSTENVRSADGTMRSKVEALDSNPKGAKRMNLSGPQSPGQSQNAGSNNSGQVLSGESTIWKAGESAAQNAGESITQNAGASFAFDLNTADTTMLQQLKGVGTVTANRIARYRNQLGGFYSLAQLDEIKGLYPETMVRLRNMLHIDPSRITPINANRASLEKLRAHPYISFWQAKVIVELRKSRGSIKSLQELADYKEFTPKDLDRLKWYLTF